MAGMPVVLMLAAVVILAGVVVVAMGRGGELALARPDSAAYGRELVTPADMVAFRPPAALLGYSAPVTDDALQRIARVVAERDAELRPAPPRGGRPARPRVPGRRPRPAGQLRRPRPLRRPQRLRRHRHLHRPGPPRGPGRARRRTSWDVGRGQPDYGSPLSFGARAAGAGALEQYASELAAAEPAEPAEPPSPWRLPSPRAPSDAGEQGAAS